MLLTKASLHEALDDLVRSEGVSVLNEAVGQIKRASRTGEVTLFLSHKHDDVEPLKDAIALFHSLGVHVYVDWLDETMPTVISGTTADRIKKKIEQNRKFVLLATQGAIDSKWCNWELGYGDAHKYIQHIAIMPVAENNEMWKGNEYLQIYPSIQMDQVYSRRQYYVESRGVRQSLADWLRA